jgi:hypothetical protein
MRKGLNWLTIVSSDGFLESSNSTSRVLVGGSVDWFFCKW